MTNLILNFIINYSIAQIALKLDNKLNNYTLSQIFDKLATNDPTGRAKSESETGVSTMQLWNLYLRTD